MSTPSLTPAAGAGPRNRLLAALPQPEMERLRPLLEPVELALRQVVVEPNRPIEHVYFVEEGVVSLLGLMSDGTAVEIATVGREGMVGVPVFLGAESMAGRAFAQVPGAAYRMPAAALRDEVLRGGPLVALLGRYTQALLTLVSQSSACNRVHPARERCARWILLTHDRVTGDSFPLTQLFLSQMLGLRRATVSEIASELHDERLIDYSRGRLTVLDRAGLERAACECYRIVRAEFSRLLDGRALPSPLDDAPEAGPGTPDDREAGA